MVGIPTFGLSWVLVNPSQWKVGSLATRRGKHGNGFLSFAEAKWIMDNGYGGTITSSLNSDDWQGNCGNGTFPLQKAIVLQGYDSSSQGFEFHY
ncbi:hypothetical protein MRX96_047167 [Rhipicephalus microplus]